jgi:hypothetical protein
LGHIRGRINFEPGVAVETLPKVGRKSAEPFHMI